MTFDGSPWNFPDKEGTMKKGKRHEFWVRACAVYVFPVMAKSQREAQRIADGLTQKQITRRAGEPKDCTVTVDEDYEEERT